MQFGSNYYPCQRDPPGSRVRTVSEMQRTDICQRGGEVVRVWWAKEIFPPPDTTGRGLSVVLLSDHETCVERIRVAFQALRDGREHAISNLYRVLAAEFPASGEVKS